MVSSSSIRRYRFVVIVILLFTHAIAILCTAIELKDYNRTQVANNNNARKLNRKNDEARSAAVKLKQGRDTEGVELDLEKIRKKAKFFYGGKNSSLLFMGVVDELITHRMKELFRSSSGYFINSSSILLERLSSAQRAQENYCSSWKQQPQIGNIDHKPADGETNGRKKREVLLIMCLVTKYDDLDLQEWLVWQIMITGARHIIVYLNEPEADNSLRILQPFVDAGFVTTFNISGRGRQSDIYPMCVDLVRRKQCHFYPVSPASDAPYPPDHNQNLSRIFLNTKDCDPGFKMDTTGRETFITGFDTDEFPVDLLNKRCIADSLLQEFSNSESGEKGKVNGLMLPWVCFGHSQHFIAPSNSLVTELYKKRLPLPFADLHIPDVLDSRGNVLSKNCKLGKAFLRLSHVRNFINGHDGEFHNGKTSQTEFLNYSHWDDVWGVFTSKAEQRPRFLLYHYLTKSVEQLVKKYFRGMADKTRHWYAYRRDLDQVMLWLTALSGNAAELDDSIQEQSRMVRVILDPDSTHSSKMP